MKIQNFKFYLLFLILFVFGNIYSCLLFSKEKSSINKTSTIIQLDLTSNYYTFFDTRQQLRLGVEYQYLLSKHHFISSFIDLGQYDHYHFIKYDDVLNTQNFYTDKKLSLIGFHYLVGLNYFIKTSSHKSHQGVYVGIITDHSLYSKSFRLYDSKTQSITHSNYQQVKFGTGVSSGIQFHISDHLMMEGKTSFLVKLMNQTSGFNNLPISSMIAQWNDTNSNFWWISQLKIGYVF